MLFFYYSILVHSNWVFSHLIVKNLLRDLIDKSKGLFHHIRGDVMTTPDDIDELSPGALEEYLLKDNEMQK